MLQPWHGLPAQAWGDRDILVKNGENRQGTNCSNGRLELGTASKPERKAQGRVIGRQEQPRNREGKTGENGSSRMPR
jgi:hypothetical protein